MTTAKRTSVRDIQTAHAHLIVRLSDIVLQRSLWGRLRWLLLGR
jgi:hypothetical protein